MKFFKYGNPRYQKGILHPVGFWAGGALSVDATANGDTNSRSGTCYVGASFNSNGNEYERSANTGNYDVLIGQWLLGGLASDVWVVFNRTGGSATSWVGKTNGTRYNLASTQSFGITDGGGTNSIEGYFQFYDAASGGNLLDRAPTSGNSTWSATDISV